MSAAVRRAGRCRIGPGRRSARPAGRPGRRRARASRLSAPGRTRWSVCRPWRSVWRSLATVRSARLMRQASSRPADQLVVGDAREQLEPDEVDRGRPGADRADHLGSPTAPHDQGLRLGAELARVRLGLEIGDGHGQDGDVDRPGLECGLERCRVIGDRPVSQRHQVQPIALVQPSAAQARQPVQLRRGVGRIEGELGPPLQRELRRAGVDVPDRRPSIQERLGDRRGQPARGDVGQEPDVVHRRDRPTPGHDHVHPASPWSLVIGRWSGVDTVEAAVWKP